MKIAGRKIYMYSSVRWREIYVFPTIHIWNESLYDITFTFGFLFLQFSISINKKAAEEL